ncbi:hypothetical protein EYZ11_011746 [Aspergillus tanneri]|uniref:Uncharacterized protein n=1 Tax=Aspergillus tanneri TaxID=1220188 RepID=A0A4S3J460_9EURO|nr:hypothetical protein EYZ11_011746 [Aspergillus tanneri]
MSGSELDLSNATKSNGHPLSDSDPSIFNLYPLNQDKIPSMNLETARV